jgi:hypothetical protein
MTPHPRDFSTDFSKLFVSHIFESINFLMTRGKSGLLFSGPGFFGLEKFTK